MCWEIAIRFGFWFQIISRLCTLQDGTLNEAKEVFVDSSVSTPPNGASGEGGRDEYNAYITFPSSTLALVSDGKGKLLLLETGKRPEQKPWSVSVVTLIHRAFFIQWKLL